MADAAGFNRFLRAAKASCARSVSIVAHDWTVQQREEMAQFNRAELVETLDSMAKKVITELVPAGAFTPAQFDAAASDVTAAGIAVIDAALSSPAACWIFTCCGCFSLFEVEVVAELAAGAGEKFQPPAGWCCVECEPRATLGGLHA